MARKLISGFTLLARTAPASLQASVKHNHGVISRTYAEGGANREGWFSKLYNKVEPARDSHSRSLTNKDIVYEMQIHNIKPDCMGDYIKLSEKHLRQVHENPAYPCQLFGSWSTAFGPQDQAVHIWMYEGFNEVKQMSEYLWEDKDYLEYKKLRGEMLVGRSNQLLMPFSFWGDPEPRDSPHLYEIRSYHLKPGTLIEWANNWAKGIQFRREQGESVIGLFTQIGDLYLVHHMWAYKDLQTRKEIRDAAWRNPGWDDCVAYTEPLIRKLESKILVPLPCSPLQ